MPPFEQAEYADRLRRVRERMAGQGLDVLIVSDPANMAYLTGYDGWSFYTPQGVAVGARHRSGAVHAEDGRQRRPRHHLPRRRCDPRLPRPLRAGARQASARLGGGRARGARPRAGEGRRRERRLLLHAARLPRARGGSRRRHAGRLAGARELGAGREVARGAGRDAGGGADHGAGDPDRHRRGAAGRPPVRRRRGHLRRAGRRHGGVRRGVHVVRADAADRDRHLDAAPDVVGRAVHRGRGDDPRAGCGAAPLPRADGPHRVPRLAAAEACRHGGGGGGGDGGGARRGAAGRHRRVGGDRLARR